MHSAWRSDDEIRGVNRLCFFEEEMKLAD